MDEDLGSSYITIEDEDGNEFELEQLAPWSITARNIRPSSPPT